MLEAAAKYFSGRSITTKTQGLLRAPCIASTGVLGHPEVRFINLFCKVCVPGVGVSSA